jgi:predicted dehydrogenase
MSNHMKPIGLIGLGPMGLEYAKVLKAMQVPFIGIGRSEERIRAFKSVTGAEAVSGGIEIFLEENDKAFDACIVAVDLPRLASVTMFLLKKGIKRILLEKPGGIDLSEIELVKNEAVKQEAEVFIAYNRRFYESVRKAQEIIKNDGGVKSFHFEFTEWVHVIEKLDKPAAIRENWFLANSTHVADLAFYLGGMPMEIQSFQSGLLSWNSKASVFAGAGRTETGALFSYQANWEAPGRWAVEVLTNLSRLIFRPMEQLQIQKKGSVEISSVELEDQLDKQFKPGLYNQTKAFIEGDGKHALLPISDHFKVVKEVYSRIYR